MGEPTAPVLGLGYICALTYMHHAQGMGEMLGGKALKYHLYRWFYSTVNCLALVLKVKGRVASLSSKKLSGTK